MGNPQRTQPFRLVHARRGGGGFADRDRKAGACDGDRATRARPKPDIAQLHFRPMGLQGFERRLERLVEGTFAKAFRAGLEPVEIGRKIARALDTGRMIGVHGGWVVPNDAVVYLSADDLKRFSTYTDLLSRAPASTPGTRATTSSGP